MNFDYEINRIMEAVKTDKSIVQPWRNKAAARLEEAQAFVRMGMTTTNMKPPENCSCLPGAYDVDCTTHGGTR